MHTGKILAAALCLASLVLLILGAVLGHQLPPTGLSVVLTIGGAFSLFGGLGLLLKK